MFLLFKDLKQILLVGGNSVEEDVKNIKDKGGNIIVCTPGRLEDLLTRKKDLNLAKALKSLVRNDESQFLPIKKYNSFLFRIY